MANDPLRERIEKAMRAKVHDPFKSMLDLDDAVDVALEEVRRERKATADAFFAARQEAEENRKRAEAAEIRERTWKGLHDTLKASTERIVVERDEAVKALDEYRGRKREAGRK